MVRNRYPNLRAFLAGTGRTQAEFASRLGITQSQLSKILNGRRRPPLEMALKIAEIADIPLASLIPHKREVA